MVWEMLRLHRASPPPPSPSNGSGPYGILVVFCINLWPAMRMELGQEGWLKQPVAEVRGPIMAGDQGSRQGHQCSETSLTGESQFQKCECIPRTQTAGWKQIVDPLDQWNCVDGVRNAGAPQLVHYILMKTKTCRYGHIVDPLNQWNCVDGVRNAGAPQLVHYILMKTKTCRYGHIVDPLNQWNCIVVSEMQGLHS